MPPRATISKNPIAKEVAEIRDTPESRLDPEIVRENQKPLIVDGARERSDVNPGDIYHLTEETRRDLGIEPHEEVSWPRSGDVWKKDEKIHRSNQVIQQSRGAVKLVTDSSGQPVMVGDNVLVKYPREWHEEKEKEATAKAKRDEAAIEEGEYDDTTLTGKDRERFLREKARRSKDLLQHSQTSGMSLEMAERMFRDKNTEIETLARTGGRTAYEEPSEDEEPRSRSRNRSYSLPGRPTRR